MTDHSFNNKKMPRSKKQNEEIRKNTRALILENALLLFAEKGFDGTSISDIAKSAGISKGLAYNYFSSKNDLMISVLKLFEKEISKMFHSITQLDDPFEQIKYTIDQTFNMLKNDEKFWKLYLNFAFQPGVQKTAGKYFDEFLSEVLKTLESIFRKAGIKNASAESRMLAAILDGASFHCILDKHYPIDKMRRFLIRKYSKENLLNSK